MSLAISPCDAIVGGSEVVISMRLEMGSHPIITKSVVSYLLIKLNYMHSYCGGLGV